MKNNTLPLSFLILIQSLDRQIPRGLTSKLKSYPTCTELEFNLNGCSSHASLMTIILAYEGKCCNVINTSFLNMITLFLPTRIKFQVFAT